MSTTEIDKTATKNEVYILNNETFFKDYFMDISCISVIRNGERFYNFTKVIKDNTTKKDLNEIMRNKYWTNYVEAIKKVYKYDENNNKIMIPQKMRDQPDNEKNCIRELQKEDYSFVIKGKISNEEILGTYYHEIFMNYFCEHVNLDYAVKVSRLMILVNEELHLKNISLEQKIEEQQQYIEEYKRNINSGFNNERRGSIIIYKSKPLLNYKLVFKDNSYYDGLVNTAIKIINDVYNVQRIKNLINFYVKNDGVKGVKSLGSNNYEIQDFNVFLDFIEGLRNYTYTYNYDVNYCINKFVNKNPNLTKQNKGFMFEFFCSQKYNIPSFKYTKTEKLGLTKIDKGIDLLDLDNKIVAQCKYYENTILDTNKLNNYISFCKEFVDYKRLLFVNESIKINVINDNYFDIIKVSENEFNEWIRRYYNNSDKTNSNEIKLVEIEISEPKFITNSSSIKQSDENIEKVEIKNVKTVVKTDVKNSVKKQYNYDISDSLYNEISEYIISTLNDKYQIKLTEMLKLINLNFDLPKFMSECVFTKLFSNLYQKTHNDTIPRDKENNKLLIRLINKSEEEDFIKETIGIGQYLPSEYVKIHNEHFKTNYCVASFTKRFSYLFSKTPYKERLLLQKKVNGKRQTVYEISDYPNRNKIFLNFIKNNLNLTMTELTDKFNKEFHTYETTTSLCMFLHDVF